MSEQNKQSLDQQIKNYVVPPLKSAIGAALVVGGLYALGHVASATYDVGKDYIQEVQEIYQPSDSLDIDKKIK